jgi:hypothetical protein
MLLNILHTFNLHYYDAFLKLETEIKRLRHSNKNLKRKKNLFRDIAKNKKKEEILETYANIKRINQIADEFILFEKVFI